MHSEVKVELERGCFEFPRLWFLQENDVLRVVSHSGSPVTILPQISRLFPAVRTVRFAEALPSNGAIHHHPLDSKEGAVFSVCTPTTAVDKLNGMTVLLYEPYSYLTVICAWLGSVNLYQPI